MPITLPDDVVAIDTGEKSLLFYVYPNSDKNYILSYLESPDDEGNGNFEVNRIQLAKNPFNKNKEENIFVSPNNKQVAAITWKSTEGIQVRVYYVDRENNSIRELCKTGDGRWFVGSLSAKGKLFAIRAGTSISASVHADQAGKNYEIRVFASEEGMVNTKKLPQIAVFKYRRTDGAAKDPSWGSSLITDDIDEY